MIIVATGYDSVTGSLYDMDVIDQDGIKLQERWKDGIYTYLGMFAPGFPNAFILYGLQAPSGLVNGPPFLELQVDWVVKCLNKFEEAEAASFEASAKAAEEYRLENLDVYNSTFFKTGISSTIFYLKSTSLMLVIGLWLVDLIF